MYEFQEDTKSLLNPATGMSLMTLARAVSARGQGWKSDYHDRGYGEVKKRRACTSATLHGAGCENKETDGCECKGLRHRKVHY